MEAVIAALNYQRKLVWGERFALLFSDLEFDFNRSYCEYRNVVSLYGNCLDSNLSAWAGDFFVASHSLKYGAIRSIKTILGNVTGLAILSGLSVIGLSALLIYAPFMFTLVKIVGAIYLAYLGIKLWCNRIQPIDVDKARAKGDSEYLYLKSVFIALSNPKAIIFTTSLFSQFIDHANSVMSQFLVFLSTFMGLSFVCLLGCSVFVRFALCGVAVNYSRFIGRLFGGTLIGASGVLSFSSSR